MIDNWQTSDTITVKINSNSSFVKTMNRGQRQTWEKTSCGNTNQNEIFLRFDQTYNFNISLVPYTVSITTNTSTQKWGVR